MEKGRETVVKTEEREVNGRRMDLGREGSLRRKGQWSKYVGIWSSGEEGGVGGVRSRCGVVVKEKEDKTELSGGRNTQLLGVRGNQQKRTLVAS